MIMASVSTNDAPTATATARATEEESLESISDCDHVKKTVDSIRHKAKMEFLRCGMVDIFNSTKLTRYAEKKRR